MQRSKDILFVAGEEALTRTAYRWFQPRNCSTMTSWGRRRLLRFESMPRFISPTPGASLEVQDSASRRRDGHPTSGRSRGADRATSDNGDTTVHYLEGGPAKDHPGSCAPATHQRHRHGRGRSHRDRGAAHREHRRDEPEMCRLFRPCRRTTRIRDAGQAPLIVMRIVLALSAAIRPNPSWGCLCRRRA